MERSRKISNLRWWIAVLLATATALNYLDRQSLPVVVSELQKSISVSDRQYSQIQFLFLLAYGLMYSVGGRIMDLLGTRAGYTLMIVWWSAATFLQGAAHSVVGLGITRFLLGLGEGGGFPGSAKAVSEWFPAKERSLAFGIFNTGSSVGAVIAPPLIALIVMRLNWRWVFFLTGCAGFGWAIAWLQLYELPGRHQRITAEEKALIASSLEPATTSEPARIPWLSLFAYRQVWGLLAAKFLADSAWYFYIFWLPKYLADIRHLNIQQIGYYAWIPYAFAGVGSFAGGWLSSFLIRRGVSIDKSRKIAFASGAALMPVSLLIAASPLSVAIVFFGLAMLGHQWWSTILQTVVADMFPSSVVGSVAGLLGAVGSFGGMLFSLLVGSIVSHQHGYSTVFVLVGLMHPVGFAAILMVVRRIAPVLEHQTSLSEAIV